MSHLSIKAHTERSAGFSSICRHTLEPFFTQSFIQGPSRSHPCHSSFTAAVLQEGGGRYLVRIVALKVWERKMLDYVLHFTVHDSALKQWEAFAEQCSHAVIPHTHQTSAPPSIACLYSYRYNLMAYLNIVAQINTQSFEHDKLNERS